LEESQGVLSYVWVSQTWFVIRLETDSRGWMSTVAYCIEGVREWAVFTPCSSDPNVWALTTVWRYPQWMVSKSSTEFWKYLALVSHSKGLWTQSPRQYCHQMAVKALCIQCTHISVQHGYRTPFCVHHPWRKVGLSSFHMQRIGFSFLVSFHSSMLLWSSWITWSQGLRLEASDSR
jgi:hypothetical protein